MNKKNNRKGFTTVELIIVIAVIAILATVLIPTFSNLIGKAQESAALQEASSTFKNYTIANATTFSSKTIYIVAGDSTKYVFKAENGQLSDVAVVAGTDANKTKTICGAIVITSGGTDGWTTGTLPAGYATPATEHGTKNNEGKCPTCDVKLP